MQIRPQDNSSIVTPEMLLNPAKRLEIQEKLKQGLAGQKIGKHKVPEGEIDVQLGEELSESLRALKVCAPPRSSLVRPIS